MFLVTVSKIIQYKGDDLNFDLLNFIDNKLYFCIHEYICYIRMPVHYYNVLRLLISDIYCMMSEYTIDIINIPDTVKIKYDNTMDDRLVIDIDDINRIYSPGQYIYDKGIEKVVKDYIESFIEHPYHYIHDIYVVNHFINEERKKLDKLSRFIKSNYLVYKKTHIKYEICDNYNDNPRQHCIYKNPPYIRHCIDQDPHPEREYICYYDERFDKRLLLELETNRLEEPNNFEDIFNDGIYEPQYDNSVYIFEFPREKIKRLDNIKFSDVLISFES